MTDRQTDARGKTICLPTLSGGDIIIMLLLNTKHIQNLQEFYIFKMFPRSDIYFIPNKRHPLYELFPSKA